MKKNGFTIIETTLVLAIGGLILVLAFVALPSLWRSQRDSQRKEDVASLASAIKKYQSNNNRGVLPSSATELTTNVVTAYIGNSFEDPDGTSYTYVLAGCDGDKSLSANAECTNTAIKAIQDQTSMDYVMYVATGASCAESGHYVVKSANGRKAAIMYRMESGNEVYCYDL